jgi:nucleoside-diphosphate-sugar epimerase
MRVLVIGGTKFIGPHVVRQLADQGYDVTVYHRGEHNIELPEAVREIRSPSAGIPVLKFPDGPFDVAVHMIPMGETDGRAVMNAFRGRAHRVVAVSSGDVYRAFGVLNGTEPGPIERGALREDSPLRENLYPYREKAKSPSDWTYQYEKILMEREVLHDADLRGVVLRLPKVYGPGSNADLATVYAYRHQPTWRWTHGYVENIAAAIVLAATHPAASGIYNVGEHPVPSIGERLISLPPSEIPIEESDELQFAQDIIYDTSRIRSELSYAEPVSYEEGIRRTLAASRAAPA